MISLIAAVAQNGVIGNRNAMPWNLPTDFQWFKEKTLGKQLVLGRKTYESIGKKPLPNRTHIVLTSQRHYEVPKICTLAHSIGHALSLMLHDQEVMVCGGGIVYRQFLPMAEKMYITRIRHPFKGDVFFPEVSMIEWKEIERKDFPLNSTNAYAFSIITLVRREG